MIPVLLLQSEQVIVYQAGRVRAGCVATFKATPIGVEDFKQFLRKHAKTIFIVVLDLEGEQLQLQKIPRMSKRDQQSMLHHHQLKLFGDTPYASGMVENPKRHTDTRLSVTQIGLPADIDCVWLTTLSEANSIVGAFHWMSLLVYPLAEAENATSALSVFMLRLSVGDDRITVFDSGRPLIYRRLTEQSTIGLQVKESEDFLAEQLKQTFAYLERLTESAGLQAYSENELSVVAIGDFSEAELAAIDQQLNTQSIKPVDRFSQSAHSGEVASEAVTELLALSVLRKKCGSYSLIFRGARFLERRFRQALYALGISCLLGATAAYSAARIVTSNLGQLELKITQVEQRALNLRQAHIQPVWSESFPTEAIRESVLHINALELANQTTPFHFLATLAEQLTQHPSIELTAVRWATVDTEQFNKVHLDAGNHQSSRTIESGSFYPTKNYRALVTGRVALTADDYSQAMRRFRAFVASIRESVTVSSPGSDVTVVNPPFTRATPTQSTTSSSHEEFTLEVSTSRAVP